MSFYAFHSEQYQNRIIIRCQPGYHPFIFCRLECCKGPKIPLESLHFLPDKV